MPSEKPSQYSLTFPTSFCGFPDHMITSSNRNISALLAICAGNSPVTGEFPAQRPVTRSFDVSFDLRLNTRLSKQWWGWWFETPSYPLRTHCSHYPNCNFVNKMENQSHSSELAFTQHHGLHRISSISRSLFKVLQGCVYSSELYTLVAHFCHILIKFYFRKSTP